MQISPAVSAPPHRTAQAALWHQHSVPESLRTARLHQGPSSLICNQESQDSFSAVARLTINHSHLETLRHRERVPFPKGPLSVTKVVLHKTQGSHSREPHETSDLSPTLRKGVLALQENPEYLIKAHASASFTPV